MEQSIRDPAVLLKLKPINCTLRTVQLPRPPPPLSSLSSSCSGPSCIPLSFTKINRNEIYTVISTQRLVPFAYFPSPSPSSSFFPCRKNLLPLIIFSVNFSTWSNQVNPIAGRVYELLLLPFRVVKSEINKTKSNWFFLLFHSFDFFLLFLKKNWSVKVKLLML